MQDPRQSDDGYAQPERSLSVFNFPEEDHECKSYSLCAAQCQEKISIRKCLFKYPNEINVVLYSGTIDDYQSKLHPESDEHPKSDEHPESDGHPGRDEPQEITADRM